MDRDKLQEIIFKFYPNCSDLKRTWQCTDAILALHREMGNFFKVKKIISDAIMTYGVTQASITLKYLKKKPLSMPEYLARAICGEDAGKIEP